MYRKKATVVLLTEATSNDEKDTESILGGMLPMDDSNTLFVKFRGPTEIARKEQKNSLHLWLPYGCCRAVVNKD